GKPDLVRHDIDQAALHAETTARVEANAEAARALAARFVELARAHGHA
ncbi:MAG: hypothetical protein JHC83_10745, partial [Thermoleophilia bacterium]|nr:hypothetical protein [Thermoleophilia bacterium]